jgi:hypothetical protein
MSFNISQFKSALNNFGGPSRASLFEVSVINPPTRGTSVNATNFQFFCQSAVVPGIQIETQLYAPVAGRPVQFPTGITPSPFNAIFLMDSEHQLLEFFHKWIQQVVNYGVGGGKFSSISSRSGGTMLPFEIGYMADYSADIIIKHYTVNSDGTSYYETKLQNAYPVAVGDIDLAWSDNDSYLTLPVSFAYEQIVYSGEETGNPLSGLGRGAGILDALGAIAGFVGTVQQTVKQGTKFDSVQDAVNRIYRVRNSFNRMTNTLG